MAHASLKRVVRVGGLAVPGRAAATARLWAHPLDSPWMGARGVVQASPPRGRGQHAGVWARALPERTAWVRGAQTGYIYHYALVMIFGVLVLMTYFVWLSR